ncbi:MAG: GNAT family N-acetyltransferase [Vampirovibrionales bacterium]|nr:GNAT family N-acetyltransferase [Vampirovibrionales bacterium]
MITVIPLTEGTVGALAGAYARFATDAVAQYHWRSEPAPFEDMARSIASGALCGLMAQDAEGEPVGWMLYVVEAHRAVEINLIAIDEHQALKPAFDALMRGLLQTLATRDDWDCVSYAMLGCQDRYASLAPWYGLMPVGQTIQRFNLADEISIPILAKHYHSLAPLPEDLRLSPWLPDLAEAAAEAIAEAFARSNDARWDPRFRSVAGARQAVAFLQEGRMGAVMPQASLMLLNRAGAVEGFCFLIQGDGMDANVPLIGVRPSLRHRGMGIRLLACSLVAMIERISAGEAFISEVTATVDTDNYFALKMYRKLGFQETVHYPHAWLDRQSVARSYYGRRLAAYAGFA